VCAELYNCAPAHNIEQSKMVKQIIIIFESCEQTRSEHPWSLAAGRMEHGALRLV
jgi:hypothetical protein